MKDCEETKLIVEKANKNFLLNRLKCFCGKHIEVLFWSSLFKCFYHQCCVCGKQIGMSDTGQPITKSYDEVK